jgi:hypothetical protein
LSEKTLLECSEHWQVWRTREGDNFNDGVIIHWLSLLGRLVKILVWVNKLSQPIYTYETLGMALRFNSPVFIHGRASSLRIDFSPKPSSSSIAITKRHP